MSTSTRRSHGRGTFSSERWSRSGLAGWFRCFKGRRRDMEAARVELKRALGPWAAASIVVGTVIGSGIFLVPKTMIQKVGTVEAVFAVWVVGGLLSLAGALSYGELGGGVSPAGGGDAFSRGA